MYCVAKRIRSWLEAGFADEVKGLQKIGVSESRFQEFGFEYTLMLSHLAGEITEKELIQKFIEKNWQYAKRQYTWLKRDKDIVWFTPEDREQIFEHINTFLKV